MKPDTATDRSGSAGRAMSRLKLSAVILPLMALPAFAQDATGEAPALADMVAAGSLPPVAERVGDEPEVVSPLDQIGTYGGDLRIYLRGSSDHNHILRVVGPQGLVRWDPQYTEIVPNVAESVEVTEGGRVFTFYLRDGMKWSDGTPFTADDVMFNVEDLVLNEEFAPTPPRYTSGGEPMSIEKVDDYTVRFTFKEPYGDFLAELASPLGQHPVLYAKHYCSQFLPAYNSDGLASLIEENGATDWQNLFLQKCGDLEIPARWGNAERPTLDPWVISEPYVGGATRVVLKRNPYFWQIDTEGNQLPYIDQVVAPIDQDVESLILSVMGGNVDFGLRHIDPPANRPVLAENREKGDYDFFEAKSTGGTDMSISLNLTHKDPDKRALFREKDFRVALSIGMDRQAIIDTVMLGQGAPWQQGPFEDHPYHHEQIATQFLEHDPERANELLDGLGLERGDDGIRRMANGEPVRFQIDVIPTFDPTWVDSLQLIEQQWAEIGVDMEINPLERTFFYERTSNSNDHDAAIWRATQSWVAGQIPQMLVPVHHDSRYGIAWKDWYLSGGEEGEEPPESIKKRLELYDAARGMTDADERREAMLEIAQIAADEFETIGVSQALPTYGIVKNDLMNVPESMPSSWYYPTPSPTLPQSWYWKSE